MRVRLTAMLALLLLMCVFFTGCHQDAPEGENLSIKGTSLLVWDAAQPKVSGVTDYASSVRDLVAKFAEETGVNVDLRFVSRQDVIDVLTGVWQGDVPDLLYTGESPMAPAAAQDLTGSLVEEGYVPAAIDYWRSGESLAAIPACIYWMGAASRAEGSATAYIWDSPVFLQAALGTALVERDVGAVSAYLEWVLDSWGEAGTDPLLDWAYEVAGRIYPVTPHLWQHLSAEEALSLEGVPGPSGDGTFYYTVPGYVVLRESEPEKSSATQLGVLLAANLGRWAARALGCVPALREDFSLFALESGFSYDDRAAILSSVNAGGRKAPGASSFLEEQLLNEAVRKVAGDFFSGNISVEEERSGIQEALRRNTRP